MQEKFTKYSFFFVIIATFVAINIYLTQNVPLFLFDTIYAQDPQATVTTFSHLQKHPHLSHYAKQLSLLSSREINASISEKKNRQEKALVYYDGLLIKNPKATEVLLHISQTYEEQGQTQKAYEYFEKAHQLDPRLVK